MMNDTDLPTDYRSAVRLRATEHSQAIWAESERPAGGFPRLREHGLTEHELLTAYSEAEPRKLLCWGVATGVSLLMWAGIIAGVCS
jgi:hypothetical protein